MKLAVNVIADLLAILLLGIAIIYAIFAMILLIIIFKVEVYQVLLIGLGAVYIGWRIIRRGYAKSLFNTKQSNRRIGTAVFKPRQDVDAATELQRDKAEWDRILSE